MIFLIVALIMNVINQEATDDSITSSSTIRLSLWKDTNTMTLIDIFQWLAILVLTVAHAINWLSDHNKKCYNKELDRIEGITSR
jgi:hypothetical protein